MVRLFFLVVCLVLSMSVRSFGVMDRSYRTTKTLRYEGLWGGWGNMEYCPLKGHAISFSQKVEQPQGGGTDDTALNSICLQCSNGGQVCSRQGSSGVWSKSVTCQTGYVGADFKFEPFQGGRKFLGPINDDTAGNDLELVCSTGHTSHRTKNGGPFGTWLGYQYCSQGQVICGLQTRVEPHQGAGRSADDTALNGVVLQCCSKILSVEVRLVKVTTIEGVWWPGTYQVSFPFPVQFESGYLVSGLVEGSVSDFMRRTVFPQIVAGIQSTADYEEAAQQIAPHISGLASTLKSALNTRQSGPYDVITEVTVTYPIQEDLNVYVPETTIKMTDGVTIVFRKDETVTDTQLLDTSVQLF